MSENRVARKNPFYPIILVARSSVGKRAKNTTKRTCTLKAKMPKGVAKPKKWTGQIRPSVVVKFSSSSEIK